MKYKYCTVQKQSLRKGAWVPEEIAKVGTAVEINGDDGWVICALSGMAYPLELALAQSRDPIAKTKS
jgi:hypothetical protein